MKKLLKLWLPVALLAMLCACKQTEGSVYGVVTDLDTDEPVIGAVVELGSLGDCHTGNDGRFVLEGIQAGEYTVKVRKSGFLDRNMSVSVAEGGKTEMNVSLVKEIAMVYVEGGSFSMGASDYEVPSERPVHEVTLDGFYIGKYEVTQSQWETVMGTTLRQQFEKSGYVGWSSKNVGGNHPIDYVTWDEASAFCEKLSAQTGKTYRLPTEAEWEYAARGGQHHDGTQYAGSDEEDEVSSGAVWSNVIHPVGQKKANGLGLYDMSGNVSEWCSDYYSETYYEVSPSVNPQGPDSPDRSNAHVVRVGGRVAARYPGYIHLNYAAGFRVACEL